MALIHDGALDMQLWPGPGFDADLAKNWGDGLQKSLDAELRRNHGDRLAQFEVARVAPGKLHCDFLAWVGLREPEPGGDRAQAPDGTTVEKAVHAALTFVSERGATRVALGALGSGKGEMARNERLVHVIEAANAFYDHRRAHKLPLVIEDVLVCDPLGSEIDAAHRKIRGLVTLVGAVAPKPAKTKVAQKKSASSTKKAAKTKGARVPKSAFSEDELVAARKNAEMYSVKRTYMPNDWVIHPKFGLGRVDIVIEKTTCEITFQDGSTKKLICGRS